MDICFQHGYLTREQCPINFLAGRVPISIAETTDPEPVKVFLCRNTASVRLRGQDIGRIGNVAEDLS